jgi:hypothetical protein
VLSGCGWFFQHALARRESAGPLRGTGGASGASRAQPPRKEMKAAFFVLPLDRFHQPRCIKWECRWRNNIPCSRIYTTMGGSLSTRYVANWQQECAAAFNCTSPGLVDINGHPILCNSTIQSSPEVWGITYGACQATCGMNSIRQVGLAPDNIPVD